MPKVEWRAIREKKRNDASRSSCHAAQWSGVRLVLFSAILVVASAQTTTDDGSADNPTFTVIRVRDVYDADTEIGFTGILDGKLSVAPVVSNTFTVYGTELSSITDVYAHMYNGSGTHPPCARFELSVAHGKATVARGADVTFALTLPDDESDYQLCMKVVKTTRDGKAGAEFIHVPDFDRLLLRTHRIPKTYMLYLPVQIGILVLLLMLSGTFSGLNLGLMSLDPAELQLIVKSGSVKEKRHAATILPVRKKGNYLLCTLLFGNVIVNAAIALLFDDLTSGLVALCVSSLGIVVFGEIIPQAVCNRQGLAVGAYTIWLTRAFMIITFPLSFPVSLILDKCLGEEAGIVYNRERLIELIKMSANDKEALGDELKIVSGALEYTKKTVTDVMTTAENVFMLQCDVVLNSKSLSDILKTGYTRIPVYEDDRNKIVSLFNVKDLALLDPDDNFTVRTLCSYYDHKVRFVMEDTPLKVMLDEFRKGQYHMAMVQKVHTPDDRDPYYKLTGIVTLEDIIEEIIQAEINDETDAYTDNRMCEKMKRQDKESLPGYYRFMSGVHVSSDQVDISTQLQLAAIQYLTSQLAPFSDHFIKPQVLHRLVLKSVRRWNFPTMLNSDDKIPPRTLFAKGKAEDKFILMLEGRVQVTIGQSNQTFDTGPFFHFGQEVLKKTREWLTTASSKDRTSVNMNGKTKQQMMFTPDYTATAHTEITFLEVTVHDFIRAYTTSRMDGKKIDHVNDKSRLGEVLRMASDLRRSLPQLNGGDEKEPLIADRELGSTSDDLEAICLVDGAPPSTDRGYGNHHERHANDEQPPRPSSNHSAHHQPMTQNGDLEHATSRPHSQQS